MSKLTPRDAAEQWITRFDHVPTSVIEKMSQADPYMSCYNSDSLRLVAGPRIECTECDATYEGTRTLEQLHDAQKQGQGEACLFCDANTGDDWVYGRPSTFPCGWGRLFAPREHLDREWVLEHAQDIARLELFVFESEDYGCLLGIDGAGYDFYDAFWVPLYTMRGLQWHELEE